MSEELILISKTELRELLHDSLTLLFLQQGGVDNWEWYCDSIEDGIKANTDPDVYFEAICNHEDCNFMSDIIDKELQNIIDKQRNNTRNVAETPL